MFCRSLTSQGIKQLYPAAKYDWKAEMKKLNRSAVAAFLDLVEILIRAPDDPERIDKIHDIQIIFINMHHLLNEHRPLQARDQLAAVQKTNVECLEHNVKEFRNILAEGRDCLKFDLTQMINQLDPVPTPSKLSGVRLDDDESEMPVLKKEEPMVDESDNLVYPVRLHAKPTAEDLRERMRIAFTQLPSPKDS